jgi:hypothetical protein
MHWLSERRKLTAEPPKAAAPEHDGTSPLGPCPIVLITLLLSSSNYWQDNPWRPYKENPAGAAEQILVRALRQQQGGMAGFYQQQSAAAGSAMAAVAVDTTDELSSVACSGTFAGGGLQQAFAAAGAR